MSDLTALLAARTPRALYPLLRTSRTAALRVLGPFDWALRAVTGRRSQPPLWLRRHVGPLWALERAAGEISAVIALSDLVRPDSRVVDVGCGSGGMVPDFQRMLGPRGAYVGFDVHAPSIAWCRRQFANDRRFRFELAPVHTPYSQQFTTQMSEFRFPVDDGSADFVLAKSVFTHMMEGDMRHYLAEVRRVLASGGAALLTAFLVDNGARAPEWNRPTFDFAFGDGPVRWETMARPARAVGYDAAFFRTAVADAGLAVRRVIPGYWSGRGIAPNAQDLLVVEPA
jgi:SAM-dependent methyltransferase